MKLKTCGGIDKTIIACCGLPTGAYDLILVNVNQLIAKYEIILNIRCRYVFM
jgi:hypothetical protein